MIPYYLIELHPLKKNYLKGYYSGYIQETNEIKEALHFASYKDAQKELIDIVRINQGEKELYISIVEFYFIIE